MANTIIIDSGRVHYDVQDASGNVYASLDFNPADPGIATRGEQAIKSIRKLLSKYKDAAAAKDTTDDILATLDAMAEAEKGIRSAVVYMLGTDSTTTIFDHISPIAITEDGGMFVEKVLDAIVPEIEAHLKTRLNNSRNHMAAVSGRYANNKAFLQSLDAHEAAKNLPGMEG